MFARVKLLSVYFLLFIIIGCNNRDNKLVIEFVDYTEKGKLRQSTSSEYFLVKNFKQTSRLMYDEIVQKRICEISENDSIPEFPIFFIFFRESKITNYESLSNYMNSVNRHSVHTDNIVSYNFHCNYRLRKVIRARSHLLENARTREEIPLLDCNILFDEEKLYKECK